MLSKGFAFIAAISFVSLDQCYSLLLRDGMMLATWLTSQVAPTDT